MVPGSVLTVKSMLDWYINLKTGTGRAADTSERGRGRCSSFGTGE